MAEQYHRKQLKTAGFFNRDSTSQCTLSNYVLALDKTKRPTKLKDLKKKYMKNTSMKWKRRNGILL
jgi:hypothetical protein